MKPRSSPVDSQLLSLALTAAILILLWLPYIHSITTEYFDSYRRIFQQLSSQPINQVNADTFGIPTLADVFATIFDSPFLGLQISTLISIVSWWFFILLIVWSLPPRVAMVSSAALSIIVICTNDWSSNYLGGFSLRQVSDLEQLNNQTIIFAVIAICLLIREKQAIFFVLKLLILVLSIFLLSKPSFLYLLQAIAVGFAITIGHYAQIYRPNLAKYLKSACSYFFVLILVTTFYLIAVAWFPGIEPVSNQLKYIFFSLVTMSLVLASVFVGIAGAQLASFFGHVRSIKAPGLITILVALMPIFSLYVLAGSSMPRQSAFDTRVASRVDEALLVIQRTAGAQGPGKINLLISPLANLPPVVSQVLNFALGSNSNTNLDTASQDLITTAKGGMYHWLITDNLQVPFFLKSCVMSTAGTLNAYGTECITQTLLNQPTCSGTFDLTKSGRVESSMFEGLSEAEDHGRWTDGNKALFGCLVRGATPKSLVLSVRGFTYGALTAQRVVARVNGGTPQEFFVSSSREIQINFPNLSEGSIVIVDIALPNAISPRNLGLSADSRYLGVTINTMAFVFE